MKLRLRRLPRLEVPIRIASAVFALILIAATAAHVLQLRASLFAEADARLRTLSRMLAGQLNQTLGTLEMAFEQIEQPLADALADRDGATAAALLATVARRELLLRELAVVDAAGRIVASSQPRSIGRKASDHGFPDERQEHRHSIGLPRHGRGLDAGAPSGESLAPARAGFITFSWRMPAGAGERTLVAVIGTDSLINELRYLAGGDAELLALYRYDGALLAASDDAQLTRSSAHPIFTRFLPAHEAGDFTETLGDGRRWVVHFATAADHPVVVEARLQESVLLASLPGRLVVPVGVMTAIVVALFLYTRLITGALRERRRQEYALSAARDAAESAVRARTRFLATMSHELRTPMTGILGMIDLLDDGGLPPEQARLLRVLRESARSLRTVLDDVLDYSKADAGRLQLESIDFDPAAVAREVVELLSATAASRGNRIREQWDPAAVEPVRGDPTRLRQVLVNLVGNAIKFTEGGSITVKISRQPADSDDAVALRFEVEDTGIGIAPDVLPTLFQPFRQADSSTSRRFGGTGLGLAICRQLIDAMGGRIGVDGEPGRGSRFWFELQLPRAAARPQCRPAHPERATRQLRVLVAEDHPTNRLLICTQLRRTVSDVDTVSDGGQAIDAVRNADYDLVLMDLQMPGIDGLEATRAIRALPGERSRVPIVALTADVLSETRAAAFRAGVDDYLSKPIDRDELDRVLTRAAAGLPPAAAPDPVRPDEAGIVASRRMLGDDVHRALLDVYWQQTASDIDACRAALAAGDRGALIAAAHGIKGASASVGLHDVAAAADRLERCAAADAGGALRRVERGFAAAMAAWRLEARAPG